MNRDHLSPFNADGQDDSVNIDMNVQLLRSLKPKQSIRQPPLLSSSSSSSHIEEKKWNEIIKTAVKKSKEIDRNTINQMSAELSSVTIALDASNMKINQLLEQLSQPQSSSKMRVMDSAALLNMKSPNQDYSISALIATFFGGALIAFLYFTLVSEKLK